MSEVNDSAWLNSEGEIEVQVDQEVGAQSLYKDDPTRALVKYKGKPAEK